jgi:hypothetical protein
MMPSSVYVEGCGWLAPFATLDDVFSAPRTEQARPDLSLLERSLRRGLSDVTRFFTHAAKLAIDDAKLDAQDIPTIFASAFGEIGVAHALLAHAVDEDGSSPARFRNSVHNTAPGLLSISAGNRQPASALSAGFATTAMGLLEASMQLARDCERLLLVFAEEPVPVALSAAHRHGPLAVAFVLARETSAQTRARFFDLRNNPGAAADNTYGPERHPLWPALLLARAITLPQPSQVRVGADDAPYTVEVEPLERR